MLLVVSKHYLLGINYSQNLYCFTLGEKVKFVLFLMSLDTRKPVFRVSVQDRLKPACPATEAMERLEISNIENRGNILSRQRAKKGTDQTARMRGLICTFVVSIWQNQVFSWCGSNL